MKKETEHSMIRVNHAGEYGATRIYAGQLWVLGQDETIKHMEKQEEDHLKEFQKLLIERRVRPSLLQPFWHVGGFLMGAISAYLGRNAAHACTAAVETIIDEHYQSQKNILTPHEDSELYHLIEKCQQDECEHKNTALLEAGEDLEKTYPILTFVIKGITKTAIEIAKRI